MQGISAERRAHRDAAAGALGESASHPRVLVAQKRAQGLEADIMALPVVPSTPIQDLATGGFYFMIGVSALGEDALQ